MTRNRLYGAIAAVAGLAILVAGAYLFWVWPRDARPAIGDLGMVQTADGDQVAYYDSGPREGRVIVMLASLGRSVSDLNELAGALNEAGFRTILVEMRGVARSGKASAAALTLYDMADDIDAALTKAGVPKGAKIDLIGHAFGNRLARAFASQRADHVGKIVLIAAGGAQNLKDTPIVLQALLNSFVKWRPPAWRKKYVKYAFFADDSKVPNYWMNGWYSDAAMMQSSAIRRTPEEKWREAGGRAPILIIQAADDRVAPPDIAAEMLHSQMPDRVKIVRIDNAGHALLPEHPEAVSYAILNFLDDQF